MLSQVAKRGLIRGRFFSDKSGPKSAIFAIPCIAMPRPVNPITTKVVFTDGSSGIYLPDIPVGSATSSR